MAGFPEDEGALRPDDEAAPPKPKKKYPCGLCHEPGHDRRSCPHFGPRAAGPYRDIDHRKLGNGSMDALLLAVTGLEQGGPSPTTAPAPAELAAEEEARRQAAVEAQAAPRISHTWARAARP